MKSMNNAQPIQSQHAERQYLHTMIAGALLPLAQSTMTAAVISIGSWLIAYFVFDVQDSYKVALFCFAVTWVYMIWKLQRHWLSLTTIERVIHYDINGDGVIGEATEQPRAEEKPRKILINLAQVSTDRSYQSNLIKLPGSDDQLNTLANGLINGMPLSEKTWTPQTKLYSIQDFRELKTAMFAHALAEYVSEADKRQGIRLTAKGMEFMKQVAASPLPQQDE